MKNFGGFLKKHLVLIICIIVAVAALGAGIWFLANPEQPEDPANNTSQTPESTGDLELDTDMGFGDVDMGSGVVPIPGGDTPSGEITPVNPDNQTGTNQGDENQGEQESNTVEMSGSVVENPFK